MTIQAINYYTIHFVVKYLEQVSLDDTLIICEDNELDAVATAMEVVEKEYGTTKDSVIQLTIKGKPKTAYVGLKDKIMEI